MRKRHGKDLTESVMLGHASQTSHVMQNVHDKPGNLPDPDIFAVDTVMAFFSPPSSSTNSNNRTNNPRSFYQKGKSPLPISKTKFVMLYLSTQIDS